MRWLQCQSLASLAVETLQLESQRHNRRQGFGGILDRRISANPEEGDRIVHLFVGDRSANLCSHRSNFHPRKSTGRQTDQQSDL